MVTAANNNSGAKKCQRKMSEFWVFFFGRVNSMEAGKKNISLKKIFKKHENLRNLGLEEGP